MARLARGSASASRISTAQAKSACIGQHAVMGINPKFRAERDAATVALCDELRGKGRLTYEELAKGLNMHGRRTEKGELWSAQAVYICHRRQRLRDGKKRQRARDVHELIDGRWRHAMRAKILELKSYGVTRYDDIAEALNKEGITTRLGRKWTRQAVFRLMRSVGLSTGKTGRRRHDE